MRLEFHRHDRLPRLAWLAEIRRGTGAALVHHGPWVETTEEALFEGAWDGPFTGMGFENTCAVVGSGLKAVDGGLLVVTPGVVTERTFTAHVDDTLYISNSFVFLLTHAGLDLDPAHLGYLGDLRSLRWGLGQYARELPTRQGVPVIQHFYDVLRVDRDLRISSRPKPEPPSFRDYAEYRDFLGSSLRAICDNARDPARKNPFGALITTISTGYDSVACSVVATEAGCQEAITFDGSRSFSSTDVDDRGTRIAELLGLRVKEYPAQGFRSSTVEEFAEFAALGDTGDRHFAPLAQDLRGNILVTGMAGDSVWDRHLAHPTRDFARGACGGESLAELRLRVGFVDVPLPLIGFYNRPEIHRITISEEMKPWVLGSPYDRPIARRLAEERGVPRDWFGCVKKVVAWGGRHMNPEADRSLSDFIATARHLRSPRRVLLHRVMWRLRRWTRLAHFIVARLGKNVNLHVGLPCPIPVRYAEPPDISSYLVPWGVSVLRDRYRIHPGDSGREPENQPESSDEAAS